jgi:hypothetical protein
MRMRCLSAAGVLLFAMHAQALPRGVDQAIPVRNGRPAVATVNGDAISLDEFLRDASPTSDRARLRQGLGSAEDLALVNRLITIKLIVQEAARMGLDEAPEIKKQVDVTSREILREVLFERILKDVKPDPAAVEKLFRESVREWKTTSLLFQDEGAAKRAQKELAGGAAFADVAARAVAAKTAKTDGDNAYHQKKDYLPQIAGAIAALQAGQVSPVIKLPVGFVVVRIADIRYPENGEARAEARRKVVSEQQQAILKAHDQALRRDYVVVNRALLKSVDYEAAKPGIDALLKDKRIVAEIKGGTPLTVGDLTDYLRLQFFHGTDQAAQRKRMNAKKEDALDSTLGRRLLNLEAQKLGIDKSDAYRDRVKGYRESLVFDAFVQKVIVPDSKIKEDDAKGYYAGHLREYSSPEMMRVRSLAFARRADAEDALRKFKDGADFGWLASNAQGQVGKGAPGLLTLDGQPVMTTSMPDGLQKALAGAKAKDLRLYGSPEGHFYVLSVLQVIAPNAKPYAEVREDIAKKLYGEKLKKNVEDYAGKLRAKSKTETFLKRMP